MSGMDGLNILQKIPVFIGEGHYQVLEFINRHIDAKNLPKEGNIIVKCDALPDEIIPKEMLSKTKLDPPSLRKTLFSDIGMHDWIRKSANNGNVAHVIWLKPPWSHIAEDGSGIKTIEKSHGSTTVTVDIKTLGKQLFQDQPDDFEGFSNVMSKYVSPNTPWILDIDLSFFSSINPFISLYKKSGIYPLLEKIFAYKIPKDDSSVETKKVLKYREQQIEELDQIFKHLDEHRVMPSMKNPSEIHKKVQEMKEQIEKHFEDREIDWKHMFDAGCVSNSFQLPVHHTEREKVLEMQEKTFLKMLDSCPCPPTIITIARSCEYDVFVPIKDCNFIEQNLVKTLRKKLDIDDPEMPYLDQ